MYDGYRSRSRDRDGGGYRRRSPRRRDDGDSEQYRSRKDSSRTPPRSPPSRPEEDMYRGHARFNDSNSHGRRGDPYGGRGDPYGGGRPVHRPVRPVDELYYDEAPARPGSPPPVREPGRGRRPGVNRDRCARSRSASRSGAPGWPSDHGARGRRAHSPASRGDSGLRHHSRSPARHRARVQSSRRGPANPTLILENLPNEVSEQDILLGLDYVSGHSRMSTDQIRFVRIRNNKRGGKIAFVEFRQLPDATEFFDRFYPTVSFPLIPSRGPDSELITVGVDYSRPREDMDRHDTRVDNGGWNCFECGGMNYPHRAVCYKCKAERPEDDWTVDDYGGFEAQPAEGFVLTGETDECPQQIPSQFIVIRDLEASVTEEVLAKGVMKLFVDNGPPQTKEPKSTPNKLKSTAPTNSTAGLGAPPGSLRRVFLIRDRRSNESWRYGFAEFATVEDAKAAVVKFKASAKFTIASSPVMVAFIHTGVFVPVIDAAHPDAPEFTFAPSYNPNVRVKYWEEHAYPSTLLVSSGSDPSGLKPPESDAATGKNAASSGGKGGPTSQDSSAKKAKKDKDAVAGKKAVAMAPQMQMWAKKAAELHGAPKERLVDDWDASLRSTPANAPVAPHKKAPSDGPPPEAPDSTDLVSPHCSDQYVSYADWDSLECLLCGKEKLEEWLVYHEVHTHDSYKDEAVKAQAAKLLAGRGKEPRTIVRRVPRRKCDPLPVYTSYADQDKLICYVCKREFTNVKVLRIHERESELHKRNLAMPGKIENAIADLEKEGLKPAKMFPLGYDGPVLLQQQKQGPQYRDRAHERRTVYNQPNKAAPLPAKGGAAGGEKRDHPEEAGAAGPAKKKSKGAGLLAKMGWTAGSGLGAQGDGRTEALGADLYAPGVGLGAEGGRIGDAAEEAARKTRNNFADFVEKTRDKARERYEKLG